MNYLQLHGKGKNFIKQNQLGPDSFMQLAIQVKLEECANIYLLIKV